MRLLRGRHADPCGNRAQLVEAASDALWCFVVQREACGLRDPRPVDWLLDPMESLAFLTTPNRNAFDNWFEAAAGRVPVIAARMGAKQDAQIAPPHPAQRWKSSSSSATGPPH